MNIPAKVLIVGAGGFGRSVADAVSASGHYTVAGFVDDRGPDLGQILGRAVLGRLADLPALRLHHGWVVVAIGDNKRRREVCDIALAAGFELATIVHPRAFVSPHALIGAGSMIMAGAIVGTEAQVGTGVIINAAAVVDHHARVGDFGHLGLGACMAGGAVIGAGAWLQEGVMLGAGQVVADGCVVPRLAR